MKASTAKKIWRYHAYGKDSPVLSNSPTVSTSTNDSNNNSTNCQCMPNSSVASASMSIEQVSIQSTENDDNHDIESSSTKQTNDEHKDEVKKKKKEEEENGNDEETIMDVSEDEDIFQMEGKSFHISQYIEEHNRKTCLTIHQEGTPFLSLHYPSVISSMYIK